VIAACNPSILSCAKAEVAVRRKSGLQSVQSSENSLSAVALSSSSPLGQKPANVSSRANTTSEKSLSLKPLVQTRKSSLEPPLASTKILQNAKTMPAAKGSNNNHHHHHRPSSLLPPPPKTTPAARNRNPARGHSQEKVGWQLAPPNKSGGWKNFASATTSRAVVGEAGGARDEHLADQRAAANRQQEFCERDNPPSLLTTEHSSFSKATTSDLISISITEITDDDHSK